MTSDLPLISQFLDDWERCHPGCLPLGWSLRKADRPWLRFHALPGSKRYADNRSERQTILSRANSLGDRLLGSGQSCWVVEAHAADTAALGDLAITAAESDDPEDLTWKFYVRRERWQAGMYNDKLLSIADDKPGRALWMTCDTGSVFAPYDGGFDLFPPTWQEVDRLKAERPDWLSNHPAGL